MKSGKHRRLKIFWAAMSLWVRVPSELQKVKKKFLD